MEELCGVAEGERMVWGEEVPGCVRTDAESERGGGEDIAGGGGAWYSDLAGAREGVPTAGWAGGGGLCVVKL